MIFQRDPDELLAPASIGARLGYDHRESSNWAGVYLLTKLGLDSGLPDLPALPVARRFRSGFEDWPQAAADRHLVLCRRRPYAPRAVDDGTDRRSRRRQGHGWQVHGIRKSTVAIQLLTMVLPRSCQRCASCARRIRKASQSRLPFSRRRTLKRRGSVAAFLMLPSLRLPAANSLMSASTPRVRPAASRNECDASLKKPLTAPRLARVFYSCSRQGLCRPRSDA